MQCLYSSTKSKLTLILPSHCRPAISTTNGNLRLKSRGDVVFELGESGQLQFMTANGDQMPIGEKV